MAAPVALTMQGPGYAGQLWLPVNGLIAVAVFEILLNLVHKYGVDGFLHG